MLTAFSQEVVVEWSEEDDVFVARVPALGPGCMAHGKTRGEAVEAAKLAAMTMLELSRDSFGVRCGGAARLRR